MEPEKAPCVLVAGGGGRISPARIVQTEAGYARRDIEALLALDAERLQRNRLLEAADKHIGAKAHTDRGFGRSSAIGTSKRAWPGLAAGEDRPGHIALTGEADVDAKTADRARIVLNPPAAGRMKTAGNPLGRSEDHPDPGRYPAVERANLDPAPGLSRASGQESGGEGDCAGRNDPIFHDPDPFSKL